MWPWLKVKGKGQSPGARGPWVSRFPLWAYFHICEVGRLGGHQSGPCPGLAMVLEAKGRGPSSDVSQVRTVRGFMWPTRGFQI